MTAADGEFIDMALPSLWDEFSEPVTYDASPSAGVGGGTSSIQAWRRDSSNFGAGNVEENEAARWLVQASDVAAPRRGDRIIDGDARTWYVFDVAPYRAGLFRLDTLYAKTE